MKEEQHIDFSALLASSIHDMKNSLGMVLNSLENVFEVGPGKCRCSPEQVSQLQYEAKRVNDNLVQLLTLYKMDDGSYSPAITEVAVADFLEDCYLLQKPLLDYRGIEVTIDCSPDLVWFFDPFLLESVLNNTITNAVRYTRDRLVIRAGTIGNQLRLDVEDNGNGFPKEMLVHAGDAEEVLQYGARHTKLGLYFCSRIARAHVNGERRGTIEVANDGPLGGGRFSIYLP